MAKAYLSIGSNLGCREDYLKKAIELLEQSVGTLFKCSDYFETKPWGFASCHAFLNAALIMETKLPPMDLWSKTQEIERRMGRQEKSTEGNYADRCIDIDILFYDQAIIKHPLLEIPHPKLHLRTFVLQPLDQIAADFVHPCMHKTIHQLYHECMLDNIS